MRRERAPCPDIRGARIVAFLPARTMLATVVHAQPRKERDHAEANGKEPGARGRPRVQDRRATTGGPRQAEQGAPGSGGDARLRARLGASAQATGPQGERMPPGSYMVPGLAGRFDGSPAPAPYGEQAGVGEPAP